MYMPGIFHSQYSHEHVEIESIWCNNIYKKSIQKTKYKTNMRNTKIHRLQDTFHAQYTLARLSADGGWINIMQLHMVAQLSAHFPYHFPLTNPDPNHNNLNIFFCKNFYTWLSANSKALEPQKCPVKIGLLPRGEPPG